MNRKLKRNLSALLLAVMATTNISFAAANYQYTPAQGVAEDYSQNYYQNYYTQDYAQNYSQNTQDVQYQEPATQSNYIAQKAPTMRKPQTKTSTQNKTLKARIVSVPSGTQFGAVVATPISSKYLTTGQRVTLTLGNDFYYNSALIAPAGSTVIGSVVQARKAKFGTTNGLLKLKFTQIITPYGSRIPVSAVIKTDDGKGVLLGGTKMDVTKSYAKNIAIGSAVGALAGTIFGPISGGQVGKGAALGTAVGAVGGLGKSAITKGADVDIPAGSTVQLVIDQPITATPSTSSYSY